MNYTDYTTTCSNSLSDIMTTVNTLSTLNTNGIEIQLQPGGEVYINPQSDSYTYSTSLATSTYPIYPNKNYKIYTLKDKDKEKDSEELSPIDKKIKKRLELNRKTGEKAGYYFTDVKEYVPNKVYGFTIRFYSSYSPYEKEIKTVCDESDTFSLEKAFFIALAKYEYKSSLTPEGIVKQAEMMQYNKAYIKTVENGIKLFKLLQEKKAYDKEQERLKKVRHDKYVQKKKERKARKNN